MARTSHAWACGLPQRDPLLTLGSCLVEAPCNLGEPRKVVELVDTGLLSIVPLDGTDWRRIHELAGRFADHEIDLVDFAVVRLSEKFRNEEIATVDRAHFTILRRFRSERLPLLLPG